MKRRSIVSVLILAILVVGGVAEAARVKVRHRGRRTTVVVRRGFPVHRTLPAVYVRTPRVAVRVTPRVYLPRVEFTTVVVTAPSAEVQVWRQSEDLDREDGWTDFTMNVDHRGRQLLLAIDRGPAQISFAEVVFDNGEAQVVDFNDKEHPRGVYSLLDFKDGRKVDHVRIIAKAVRDETEISIDLLS